MGRRKFSRVKTEGLMVDIESQTDSAVGTVADISDVGIGLENIPHKIQSKEPKLSIMVSGHGEQFRMHIKPKWSVLDGWSTSLGASITTPTQKWMEYVQSLKTG